jgi:hypothetical protein
VNGSDVVKWTDVVNWSHALEHSAARRARRSWMSCQMASPKPRDPKAPWARAAQHLLTLLHISFTSRSCRGLGLVPAAAVVLAVDRAAAAARAGAASGRRLGLGRGLGLGLGLGVGPEEAGEPVAFCVSCAAGGSLLGSVMVGGGD